MQLAHRVASPLRTLTLPEQTPDKPRIIVFHSTGCSNSQSSRPHAHAFFELFFVEDGEGWYSIGDRHIWAKPGDLFLIAPGEAHDPSGLDDATKWVVGFSPEALNPAYAQADMLLMLPDRLLNSFIQTENAQTKQYYVPTEMRSRWLSLLAQLKGELCDREFGFTEATRALLILLLIETARLTASELPEAKKIFASSSPHSKTSFAFY